MTLNTVGTVLGGPMIWACKASQYLRSDDEVEERGPPFWRVVRTVALDVDEYLRFLGITLGRDPVDALNVLTRAHERLPKGEGDEADVRTAYDKVLRGLPVSASDANLLLGWTCLRLSHFFYETKFCLGRLRSRSGVPKIDTSASQIRKPQTADWGPATHLIVLCATSPALRFVVDVAHESKTPASVSSLDDPENRRLVRISRRARLYSLDDRLDPWSSTWVPLTLFDARTNRPHAHFLASSPPPTVDVPPPENSTAAPPRRHIPLETTTVGGLDQ